ncbi:MAG: imidazole glycerol phosphate synthase subunit HisH [bacterium]|nr:imidazole glycerol phosphate synthase subunit HisH [bacterium]
MITIIDYGMGNLGSIKNMFKKIGTEAIISSEAKDIEQAEKLLLPGVGAFDNGMKNLKEMGLQDVLTRKVVREKTPFLGICLGMQLLAQKSEEGVLPGLGWVPGKVVRFHFDDSHSHLKIPHMGWNTLDIKKEHPLVNELAEENRFYFVHSYHLETEDKAMAIGETEYGYRFVSSIAMDNILGVQFHPEKSHKFGMQVLSNFSKWQPC